MHTFTNKSFVFNHLGHRHQTFDQSWVLIVFKIFITAHLSSHLIAL